MAGYRRKDIKNIGFDDDDDDDASPQASVKRPLYKPSAARWHKWAAKKTPVKPDVLDVEQLENARPVVGVKEGPEKPLVFPLRGSSANALPALPAQGAGSPLSHDWKPEPSDGGSSVPGFSSGAVQVNKKPAHQRFWKYRGWDHRAPQSQGSPPEAAWGSSQASQGPLPGHALLHEQQAKGGVWMFQPSRPISPHQPGYWPNGGRVSWQHNPVYANQIHSPRPPPTYIIQSSNGYRRFSKTYRKSKYTPEFAAPAPEGNPALQPAAPEHFEGPQRYGHSKPTSFY